MKEINVKFLSQSVNPDVADLVPVKVAGVYCDAAAYVTAKYQLQCIANRCDAIFEFDSTWWSFDSLAEPEVRAAAAHAATKADMIWCATCVCKPVPHIVRNWIKDWSAHTHRPDAALIALLRCPTAVDFEHSPTRSCLCRAAQAAGMEFFEKRFHCAGEHNTAEHSRAVLSQFAGHPAEFSQPVHPGIRWGINE